MAKSNQQIRLEMKLERLRKEDRPLEKWYLNFDITNPRKVKKKRKK